MSQDNHVLLVLTNYLLFTLIYYRIIYRHALFFFQITFVGYDLANRNLTYLVTITTCT